MRLGTQTITLALLTLVLAACGNVQNSNSSSLNSAESEESGNNMGLAAPSSIPAGYVYEGVGFTMSTVPAGRKPVYRLYNPSTDNHLYTQDPNEITSAVREGFSFEGIAFMAPTGGKTVDVYRLYKPNMAKHFYTASASERDEATSRHGYRYEGVSFKAHCFGACESRRRGRVNVHRFLKSYNAKHFYSISGK